MMDEPTKARLSALVSERISKQVAQIEHSLKQIDAGNPLGAEPSKERSAAYIARNGKLPKSDATAMTAMIARTASLIDGCNADGAAGPEGPRGSTMDFTGVDFLSRGRVTANAVGRIAFLNGRYQGTGFLVGEGLMLTNNHVIPSPEVSAKLIVEFDYEAGLDGEDAPVTSFGFEPKSCFVTEPMEGLDFTLIAVGARHAGQKALEKFGYIALSDAKDKHMLGILANIIQHPLGELKQVVVRENNLVSRDETVDVLHYLADTDNGSSGSPVCNNRWEPIALHHWGGAHLEIRDAQGRPLTKEVNEGIRISSIVAKLRSRQPALAEPFKDRVGKLIELWDTQAPLVLADGGATREEGAVATGAVAAPPMAAAPTPAEHSRQARVAGGQGEVTWTFPIEITVRAPIFPAAAGNAPLVTANAEPCSAVGLGSAARRELDFSDRGGYDPGFITGFVVPLPDYGAVGYRMARNLEPSHGAENPFELPYHHFSILMRADRRLAAFTACNIDGKRLAAVDRTHKTVNLEPDLGDLGAEASDAFRTDRRVADDEQMGKEFYDKQVVPGYPQPDYPGKDATKAQRSAYAKAMAARTARMFQKGHITLRGDPAWGQEDEAREAEADTFFYTNAAPQLGFFNQGSDEGRPGSKGKLRWRAVETYVLRNAFAMRKRVTAFAGPVFDDIGDIPFRGALVPKRYWKIAVWADKKKLKAIALIADQKAVLDRLTQGTPEAFLDEEEIARASEFLTTVANIESLTKLNFGKLLRQADVRAGAPESATLDVDDDSLFM